MNLGSILFYLLVALIIIFGVALLIERVRIKYHMERRDVFFALLTQVPIFGGIVLYKKLIDIERQIKCNSKRKRVRK
jgi:hypothetical protein